MNPLDFSLEMLDRTCLWVASSCSLVCGRRCRDLRREGDDILSLELG